MLFFYCLILFECFFPAPSKVGTKNETARGTVGSRTKRAEKEELTAFKNEWRRARMMKTKFIVKEVAAQYARALTVDPHGKTDIKIEGKKSNSDGKKNNKKKY